MKATRKSLTVPCFCTMVSIIAFSAFCLSFASYYVITLFTKKDQSIGIEDQESPSLNALEIEKDSTKFEIKSLQNLTDFDRYTNQYKRTVALLDLLAGADVEALQDYLRQSKDLNDYHFRRQVQNRIVQRLATVAPQLALSLVQEEFSQIDQPSLFSTIFEEWSMLNLQEAIQKARDLQSGMTEIVSSMVVSRDDLSIEERRDIARQIGCEWIAIDILCNANEASIFSDPEQEWYAFVENNWDQFSNFSELQTRALGYIFVAWFDQDGMEILDFVRSSLPQGFSMFKTITFVTGQLEARDPKLALDLTVNFATKFDHNHRFRDLAKEVAGRWAMTEPHQALKAANKVDGRSFQRMLQNSVVRSWAERDPQELLSVADILSENLQILARQHALIAIAATSPESVVKKLSDFSVRKNRDVVAMAIAKNWAKSDVSQLFTWIETDSNVSHIRTELMRAVFIELTRLDPEFAMQEALARPSGDRDVGWEASVISRLVIWGDLDTAIVLLPQVRAGITKTSAYTDVIEKLIEEQYDTKLAVDLFLHLDENEITRAAYLVEDLTRIAPKHMFKQLDKIQSQSIRSYVAGSLYANSQRDEIFNSDELKSLEAIIESGN